MTHSRSLLFSGLSLLLRRLPAVLWTFVFSLAISILFTLRLHGQLSALLDHSLASASLVRGFDLPTAASAMIRLRDNVPGGASFGFSSFAVFLVLYFVLVPGTLFCYLTGERARLATLLRQGLLHFWRFVRITVVALVVFAAVLAPLSALNTRWAALIDEHIVGRPAFLLEMLGVLALFLAASLIRLFFDFVEVYTVQLGLSFRPNGRSDRRVRKAFTPAWRALRLHFVAAWGSFLLLWLLGFAAYLIFARLALHTLAKPHAWPLIVFSQLAVFASISTRLWQRAAEVVLAVDHPTALAASTRPLTAPQPSTGASLLDVPAIVATPAPGSNVTPPGDLKPTQLGDRDLLPIEPGAPVQRDEPHLPLSPGTPIAPIQTAYDIDPFTPLTIVPNPISTEQEDALRDRTRVNETTES